MKVKKHKYISSNNLLFDGNSSINTNYSVNNGVNWVLHTKNLKDQEISKINLVNNLGLNQNIFSESIVNNKSNQLFTEYLNLDNLNSILITNEIGIITHCNANSEKLLNVSASKFIGLQSILRFFKDFDNLNSISQFNFNQSLSNLFKVDDIIVDLAKNESFEIENLIVTHSKKERLAKIKIFPIFNEYKYITHFVFQIYDLSQRYKSEKLNLENAIIGENKIDFSSEIMFTHDFEGNFLGINTFTANILGINKENCKNYNLTRFIAYQSGFEVEKYLHDIKKNKKAKGQVEIIDVNGNQMFWLFQNFISKGSDGKLFVVCNFIDISDRVKLEKTLLKQKLKSEKSKLLKDTFFANICHEIRTPLSAIGGFGKLLDETILTEEQKEYITSINLASNSLMQLVNDVLEVSKIESGVVNLESIPFSLIEQINYVRKILISSATNKNIQFICDLDDNLPQQVLGDPNKLCQILINLVNNAIKFTEKGFVKISVRLLPSVNSQFNINFKIIDTGIGIPSDKIDLIFERYTQASIDTVRKYGGTGLGLNISSSFVELMGGKLKVESKIDNGSMFSFNLLFSKIENTVTKLSSISKSVEFNSEFLKILIVDDNILNQKLVKNILKKYNFGMTFAQNGLLAIDLLKNSSFDLILLDLKMPGLNGYQTASAIRNELNLKTPIIISTASLNDFESKEYQAFGINDLILKPFTPNQLLEKITFNTKNDFLDLTYLKLVSEGNKDFEKEIIEDSIPLLEANLMELRKAIIESNISEINNIAHKLKSNYAVIGMKSSSLLDKLEEYSEKSNHNLNKIFNELETMQAISLRFLKFELNNKY